MKNPPNIEKGGIVLSWTKKTVIVDVVILNSVMWVAELGTRFFLGFALALSRSWWKLFALAL